MKINLREEIKKEFHDIASEIFGHPSEVFYWGCHDYHASSEESSWLISGDKLSIVKKNLQIEIKMPIPCVNPQLTEKIKFFINAISKPWNEWSEDEIISDPMWICLYQEANREMSDRFDNAITMFSYQDPNNKWVKRYFRWKHQNFPKKQLVE